MQDDDYKNRKKRKLDIRSPVTTSSTELTALPPIDTLRPEELKYFSREQIITYLQSQGVTATLNDTKPVLKQKLREVLAAMKGTKVPTPSTPVSNMSMMQSPLTPTNTMYPPFQSPFANTPSMNYTPSPFGTQNARMISPVNVAKPIGSLQFPQGITPGIRPPLTTPTQIIRSGSAPFTPYKPSPSPPGGPKPFVTGVPKPIIPPKPGMIPQTPPGMNGFKQAVPPVPGARPGVPPQGASALDSKQQNMKYVECPCCKKLVSIAGSNLMLHLSKCDPEFLKDFVLSDMTLQDIVTMPRKEESSSDVARQHSKERYYLNIEAMEELFSQEPLDAIVQQWLEIQPSWSFNKNELVTKISELESTMDTMAARYESIRNTYSEQLKGYGKHSKALEESITLEDIDKCKKNFEAYVEELKATPVETPTPVPNGTPAPVKPPIQARGKVIFSL